MLAKLPVPFIWGTVGGGESMPRSFLKGLNRKDLLFELFRSFARRMGELDPRVRATAKNCKIALASTTETAACLSRLGCKQVKVIPQCALSEDQYKELNTLPDAPLKGLRFISIGRPLYWKGFDLGLRAFSKANLSDAEYWIIANGVGKKRLVNLVEELGIAQQVRFYDSLPTLAEVYGVLAECHAIVHPALHEAFGNVVLEAMAAGRPALTLNIGGPALQVASGGGIMASSDNLDCAVQDLSEAMKQMADQRDTLQEMAKCAKQAVESGMLWSNRREEINSIYNSVLLNR
jgi:glycosyltransferase involved in cell wall biosynthesis